MLSTTEHRLLRLLSSTFANTQITFPKCWFRLLYRIATGCPKPGHPESRAGTPLLQWPWASSRRNHWGHERVVVEWPQRWGLEPNVKPCLYPRLSAASSKTVTAQVVSIANRPLSSPGCLSRPHANSPMPVPQVYSPPAPPVTACQAFSYHNTDSAEVRAASPHCPLSNQPSVAQGEDLNVGSRLSTFICILSWIFDIFGFHLFCRCWAVLWRRHSE